MNRRASLASLIAETLLTFHAAVLADEPPSNRQDARAQKECGLESGSNR